MEITIACLFCNKKITINGKNRKGWLPSPCTCGAKIKIYGYNGKKKRGGGPKNITMRRK